MAEAYGGTEVSERHRHRYEVNNAYRQTLSAAGAGRSPALRRTAGWWSTSSCLASSTRFVATQAHPELKSRPTRPHPLFAAFVGAAIRYNAEERLPVELPDPEPE